MANGFVAWLHRVTEQKLKIKFTSDYELKPSRAYFADAGADLKTPVSFKLMRGERALVDTGIHVDIPAGYVGYILPKSGLASHGIVAEVGVIDSGYTGAIKVNIKSDEELCHLFEKGDKIAQLVIHAVELPEFVEVKTLRPTERGAGGFGSTGR